MAGNRVGCAKPVFRIGNEGVRIKNPSELRRVRNVNFTASEIDELLCQVEIHSEYVVKSARAGDRERAWEEIANAMNRGATSDVLIRKSKVYKKKWVDMKSLVKRNIELMIHGETGMQRNKFMLIRHEQRVCHIMHVLWGVVDDRVQQVIENILAMDAEPADSQIVSPFHPRGFKGLRRRTKNKPPSIVNDSSCSSASRLITENVNDDISKIFIKEENVEAEYVLEECSYPIDSSPSLDLHLDNETEQYNQSETLRRNCVSSRKRSSIDTNNQDEEIYSQKNAKTTHYAEQSLTDVEVSEPFMSTANSIQPMVKSIILLNPPQEKKSKPVPPPLCMWDKPSVSDEKPKLEEKLAKSLDTHNHNLEQQTLILQQMANCLTRLVQLKEEEVSILRENNKK